MKHNIILFSLAFAAIATFGLTSCDKSSPKMDSKAAAPQNAPKELKIAYVENDTLTNQYEFVKDFTKILEAKSKNVQKTLESRQNALNAAAANFQAKAQQNAYTREQAEQIYAGLQKQGADLQALSQRLQGELQEEQSKYQQAFLDSVNHYLAVYNKDKKYSFIFIKGGVVNTLLYADKAYDITNEVLAGLNKAYKKPAAPKK